MRIDVSKYLEGYHFNSFDKKNYPSALIALGIFDLLLLVLIIFFFCYELFELGFILSFVFLLLGAIVIFCSKNFILYYKKKNKQKKR